MTLPTTGFTARTVHLNARAIGDVSCSFVFSQFLGQNSLGDLEGENEALLAAAYAFVGKICELHPELTPHVSRFYDGESAEEINPS